MTDEEQPPSEQEDLTGTGSAEDTPFDEFGAGGEGSGAKFRDLIDNNPMIKFGLIGAVLLTIIGGMMLFGGKKQVKNPSVVSGTNSEVKEAPGESQNVSAEYIERIKEKNREMVLNAEKTGKSAITEPIGNTQGKLPVTDAGQSTEDPLERWRRIQDERTRREQEQKTGLPQQDPNAQAIKDMAQAMSAQMQSILGSIKIDAMQTKMITDDGFIDGKLKKAAEDAAAAIGGGTGQGAGGAGQGQGAGGAAPQPVEILVPAGTITYGQLITQANSDFKQPVLGVIVGGPLAGDRIIGEFDHDTDKDYMVLTFKTVIIDGIGHSINALAIDPNTDTSGLATDVSHHYFQRIIIPGAVAFIQGLATSFASVSSTTSQSSSSTVVTTPKLTPEQNLWAGVGKSMTSVGDEVDKENKNTDTTVVVAAGTPFGLLFVDPVTDDTTTTAAK
jgi:intracellular multiplication protein IcmE